MAKAYVIQPAVQTEELPGKLPTNPIDENADHQAVAKDCVARLENLQPPDLLPEAFWSDLICMTGTNRNLYSPDKIIPLWSKLVQERSAVNFQLVPGSCNVMRMPFGASWIAAVFTFETENTPACKCSGRLSIASDQSGGFKIWLFSTMLEELRGFANPDTPPPVQHDRPKGPLDCVVIGGGMAGLSTGARLQAMGLKYLIIDEHADVGGVWAERYDNLRFHTNKFATTLPFSQEFEDKPYFLPRDDIVEGYANFARRWNLNLVLSTKVHAAVWSDRERHWHIKGSTVEAPYDVVAKHIIFANGEGINVPQLPNLPGRETYSGTVLHSALYKNADAFKGKEGVIVGAGVSGFDIAESMVASGLASVTMIQRKSVPLIPLKDWDGLFATFYNERIETNVADRAFNTQPYPITRLVVMKMAEWIQKADPHRYDALKAAGLDFYEEKEFPKNFMQKRGGHYVDIGATKLIVDGKVKVISGTEPVEYTKSGLRLANGEEVEADLIVLATGWSKDTKRGVKAILGDKVASGLQEFWGLNAEGHIRGMACPIGHPNVWYIGGAIQHARFNSRFIALQIKADLEGIPFKSYPMEP